jgi:hypothetical protein
MGVARSSQLAKESADRDRAASEVAKACAAEARDDADYREQSARELRRGTNERLRRGVDRDGLSPAETLAEDHGDVE